VNIELARNQTVSVKKSVARMITLMICTDLPIRGFNRGSRKTYTLPPLGPRKGLEGLYDWQRSSPIRFDQRTVDTALAAGLVQANPNSPKENIDVCLTSVGVTVAAACRPLWEPEIEAYFDGRGVNWIDMIRALVEEDLKNSSRKKEDGEESDLARLEMQVDRLQRECRSAASECGLDVDSSSVSVSKSGSFKICLSLKSLDISLIELNRLSDVLGTQDIALSRAKLLPTSSDVKTLVVVGWPSMPVSFKPTEK
jgi:hypothetical protein